MRASLRWIVLFHSCALMWVSSTTTGQSLELMVGHENLYVDAQWLDFFDQDQKWSLFSRSRATSDYKENTNLFTGAYANYTLKIGIGGTLVGRIASTGTGADVGIHYFKFKEDWILYALLSNALSEEFVYSWFSIFRYTPHLNSRWKAYNSLELFTNLEGSTHVASVQRLRFGLDRKGYQFGFALNLAGFGDRYQVKEDNAGVFVRKEF